MAEEKKNNIWKFTFWAIFAVIVVGGIIYLAWNKGDSATTSNSSSTCNVTVADGTIDTVDKLGPNEIKFTADNFDKEVIQAKGVVLVDAYAPWCPHCQKISTTISKLADDYVGRVKIGTMNANNQDAATKANFDFAIAKGLQGYPTIWIYKDGKVVDSFSGERKYCEIKAMLDKQL